MKRLKRWRREWMFALIERAIASGGIGSTSWPESGSGTPCRAASDGISASTFRPGKWTPDDAITRTTSLIRRGMTRLLKGVWMRMMSVACAMLAVATSAAAFAGVHTSSVPAKGNAAAWVAADDADGSVLQLGGGTATVAYDITAEGRVTNCRVVKSAGSPKIGNYICRLVVRRGRYVPGTAGTGTYSMGWAD